MSYHDRLQAELQTLLDRFKTAPPMARLQAGDLGVEHYASHLRQNYFQLRERPVILALAASRLTSSPDVVKLLHKRALEEVYHEKLALNDLRALGVDTSGIPDEEPLPETTALLAFGHYQIQRLKPVGVVGSMYFLDFVPLYASTAVAEALGRIGVPAEAMSALQDSNVVGPTHEQSMKTYVEKLVTGTTELDAVLHGMRTTAKLFTQMVGAAFEAVDSAG